MNREELQAWLLAKLEGGEQEGELDLEDLDAGETGITVETTEGTYRVTVEEV